MLCWQVAVKLRGCRDAMFAAGSSYYIVHSQWGQSPYEVAFESLHPFPYIYIPNLIRIRTDDRF